MWGTVWKQGACCLMQARPNIVPTHTSPPHFHTTRPFSLPIPVHLILEGEAAPHTLPSHFTPHTFSLPVPAYLMPRARQAPATQ